VTLFRPARSVAEIAAVEDETRAFWQERDIFGKSVARRAGGEPWVWHDGPPTANGRPHNGHVLTRVFKDVFPRFHTMRGRYAERIAGWDTHGLPVEVEVEKELGIHGRAGIEEYGVGPFVEKCMASVFRYIRDWEEMMRLALGVLDNEDFAVMEGVQANLAAGIQREIVFGRNEIGLHNFHQERDAALTG